MSLLGLFAKRIAVGLLSAWAVLTTMFLAMSATDDWIETGIEGQLRWMQASDEEIEQTINAYLADRGYDRPIYEQYLDWMGNMVMLDWGDSWATGESVTSAVSDGVVRTGMYVLPSVVLAIIIGTLIGLYAATRPESRLANLGRGSAYLFFAVPSFWLGGLCVSLVVGGVIDRPDLWFDHLLPILFTTMTLVGGYVSYSRAHALEYTSTDFVSLVRAKGASPLRVTRHIVRNAAIPLFSMLFVEVLALLVLAVFVIEMLFGIDGFGLLFFNGVTERDLPVVLGGSMVVIVLGVVGNIIQDLTYSYLDPRVDTGSR